MEIKRNDRDTEGISEQKYKWNLAASSDFI